MNADPALTESGLDLNGVVGRRAPSSVVVAELDRRRGHLSHAAWSAGPLPIVQAVNPTTTRHQNLPTTDGPARRTLVAEQQARVLYGGGGLNRIHLLVADRRPILALEILYGTAVGVELGWVAVHLAEEASEGDWRQHLGRISEMLRGAAAANSVWADVQDLLPRGLHLGSSQVRRTIAFHQIENTGRGLQDEVLSRAYLMASGSPPDRIDDMSRRAQRHRITIERTDWSALVLRDGAAFVAHQQSEEAFADSLRVLAHSVHLDALLLALVQRRLIDASGERTVMASLATPSELGRLEKQHFDFKRRFWRTSLTSKRTSPSDEVLRAFQSELLTALDVADVEERVQDGARVARTQHAERQDAQQGQLNRMVQNASVIIGAFGLAFTAAPVVSDPSWSLFGIAAVVGTLGMLLAFLVLGVTGRRARLDREGNDP